MADCVGNISLGSATPERGVAECNDFTEETLISALSDDGIDDALTLRDVIASRMRARLADFPEAVFINLSYFQFRPCEAAPHCCAGVH